MHHLKLSLLIAAVAAMLMACGGHDDFPALANYTPPDAGDTATPGPRSPIGFTDEQGIGTEPVTGPRVLPILMPIDQPTNNEQLLIDAQRLANEFRQPVIVTSVHTESGGTCPPCPTLPPSQCSCTVATGGGSSGGHGGTGPVVIVDLVAPAGMGTMSPWALNLATPDNTAFESVNCTLHQFRHVTWHGDSTYATDKPDGFKQWTVYANMSTSADNGTFEWRCTPSMIGPNANTYARTTVTAGNAQIGSGQYVDGPSNVFDWAGMLGFGGDLIPGSTAVGIMFTAAGAPSYRYNTPTAVAVWTSAHITTSEVMGFGYPTSPCNPAVSGTCPNLQATGVMHVGPGATSIQLASASGTSKDCAFLNIFGPFDNGTLTITENSDGSVTGAASAPENVPSADIWCSSLF